MTARRTLGTGPQTAHGIRAAQADLLDALPAVRLPDLDELRTRGVLAVPVSRLDQHESDPLDAHHANDHAPHGPMTAAEVRRW